MLAEAAAVVQEERPSKVVSQEVCISLAAPPLRLRLLQSLKCFQLDENDLLAHF